MPTSHGDYKKEFDDSVKHLEDVREQLSKASSLAEVSRIEREVRNALLAVIHYSQFLSFWMQDTANKRRKELRDAPLTGTVSAVSAPVTKSPAEKTKKTKAKKEKK